MEENGRIMGTVQWFSRVKGYGFVRPDEQEDDVFVHYSVIRGEGYRNLNRGQRVEFMVEDTPKGPQAIEVVGLEMDPEFDLEEGPQAAEAVGLEMDAELDVEEGESTETYA